MCSEMRNVEVKAVVRNLDELYKILREMELGAATIIKQHDNFFNIPHGRLKLRKFEDNSGELIYYERSDNKGPKLSSYDKACLSADSSDDLSKVLVRALGLYGEVKKSRHLYILGQTRIHVDSVEGLGNYLELEVVLRPEQSVEDGQEIAKSIMNKLHIDESDFIPTAYVDLLSKN